MTRHCSMSIVVAQDGTHLLNLISIALMKLISGE